MFKDIMSLAYGSWYSVITKDSIHGTSSGYPYISKILMFDNFNGGSAYFRDINGKMYIFPLRTIDMMIPLSEKTLKSKGLYNEEKCCCIDPIDLEENR